MEGGRRRNGREVIVSDGGEGEESGDGERGQKDGERQSEETEEGRKG